MSSLRKPHPIDALVRPRSHVEAKKTLDAYLATWAARLAVPSPTEQAILAAIGDAPRAPQTSEQFSEALFHIRALWTGPAPDEAPEAAEVTEISLAELEQAREVAP